MTLTETATITKRAARVVGIFGGIFILLWIAFLVLYNNVYIPYQRSQIKPEKKFGALPGIDFPASLISSASLNYSLDTESGGLPANLPRLANVYFIPPLETTLLAPERAKKLASSFGFKSGPDILSKTQYRFSDGNGGTLVADLSSGNFTFQRQPVAGVDNQPGNPLAEPDTLISEFRRYLSDKQLLKPDLQESPAQVIYDNPSRLDAKTATLYLWQDKVNGLPIVTNSPQKALISAVVTRYNQEQHYSSLTYIYWRIDPETFSTYPLKPVSQAFSELKQGSAVVVRNDSAPNASISRVYLAYFLGDKYAPFLQPVFVFEGDKFSAYVPAVADSKI